MKFIKSMKSSFLAISTLFLFTQCGGPQKEKLKIDIPYSNRTDEQKLIGVWCSSSYEPTGRTVATNSLSFKTVIYFYNDGTMEEYFQSNTSFGSGDLMDEGKDVKIVNGKLQYISSKYGFKTFQISISENNLHIVGKINVGGSDGVFTKCL